MEQERTTEAQTPDEEAEKVHAVVFLGEWLLQKAKEVAHRAADCHRDVMGNRVPGVARPDSH
jgi:hypothetical protein